MKRNQFKRVFPGFKFLVACLLKSDNFSVGIATRVYCKRRTLDRAVYLNGGKT